MRPSDGLALSSTCKSLFRYTSLAYKQIIFHLDDAGDQTRDGSVDRLRKLRDVLHVREQLCPYVEAISIRDGNAPLIARFAEADTYVSQLLTLTPNVHVFQWCGDAGFNAIYPGRTIAELRQMRMLRDLRIEGFEAPANVELGNVPADLQSLSRVVIRCRGSPVFWTEAILGSAPALQWLDFADMQGGGNPAILRYASSWMRLDTLVISSTPGSLGTYIGMMHAGLVRYPHSSFAFPPSHSLLLTDQRHLGILDIRLAELPAGRE